MPTRQLHNESDPIPFVEGETYTSPVRNRKIARKLTEDDEENFPAPVTPLLPGKMRVESLNPKVKKGMF